MRQENRAWDDFTCWLCDYGSAILIFFLVLLAGWYVRDSWIPATLPVGTTPVAPIATASIAGTPLAIPSATHRPPASPTPLPIATSTSAPETSSLPEYIVVVVPLNWQGDRASFETAAQREIAYFYSESGVDQFFTLVVKLLEDNMIEANLSSDTLMYDMVEFAAEREPADRYIGLADGDLISDGDSNVTGWTMGPNSLGVLGESRADYVIAHELGHTYGLCDEYNYLVWKEQNQAFQDGCPNPFPSECEQLQTDSIYCSGAPTTDGRNSIMGPSGLGGSYGFNPPSLEHLIKVFAELSKLR